MDAYKKAGVDISAQDRALRRVKDLLKSTANDQVLTELGAFGSCFAIPSDRFKEPVFVASSDGVGTKIRIAIDAGRCAGIGVDLVNHCVNDVLVQGALTPLFFLDYYAAGRLDPDRMVEVVEGLAAACRENGMALIGGETAEMPGFYTEGVFDLAGFIVAAAERSELLPRPGIASGDVAVGLPSNGLHTNGYSLARRIVFEKMKLKVDSRLPGIGTTVAEELLRSHRSYLSILRDPVRMGWVKGLAHITGGGLTDNIPRILPKGCDCVIQVGSWEIPEIFHLFQREGKVATEEMFQVFNMGIGMVAIVGPDHLSDFSSYLKDHGHPFNIIGSIHEGSRHVVYNLRG
ncbi:MAG TPA: phosphoribosylformylglycinamidine cyclo-ligase [Thermoanaerobaculia bacterium]|nr:phosphoribosylformylglycinamidine cyclo-ligase [Thermoanaerobaculia bacterium]HUM29775.1 phosphoribosylformylglycinamidine cyclo-ligase [Thermoanaerobaculia bacterium]HXK67075.1 phosphoribosylformylglycinamidine cyclo-ligase [Thermoanaerobaculia bacterium]